MGEKKNLFGYSLAELSEEFLSKGESKYRAKQIFQWIYQKHVYDFDAMSDISKSFREVLKAEYCLDLPKVYQKQVASDGTIKLLLEMEDGAKVETVLMRYSYGNAVCVSSQVGCNMGCAFCASGLLKKERNLTSSEMVGEVLTIENMLRENLESVSHIVVMGTGEPFDNYDEVIRFIRIMNDPFGGAIGARHITVSTCGLVPGIKRYADEGIQINLALSLHAPNDEIRNQLMPVSKAYPMPKLIEALQYYEEHSGRRLTFEYILLKGINDSLENANELADFILKNHLFAYVNLIPFNPVKEKPYERSPLKAVNAFHDALLKRGINATVRHEFGSDIDAACGQLRAKYYKGVGHGR